MVDCAVCSKNIRVDGRVNISGEGRLYHLSCAPESLLNSAISEGEAIVARGITYLVNKHLPDELRSPSWPRSGSRPAGRGEVLVYAQLLADMLKAYREELERRRQVSS
jgi:hypothetical protein